MASLKKYQVQIQTGYDTFEDVEVEARSDDSGPSRAWQKYPKAKSIKIISHKDISLDVLLRRKGAPTLPGLEAVELEMIGGKEDGD